MTADDLPIIEVPESINYIGVFLAFACQLRCTYCINHHNGDLAKGRWMDGDAWIRGLSRLRTSKGLPITLQGGEPTVHKYFREIVRGVRKELPIDVLTNLEVPLDYWTEGVDAKRLQRDAPYASIRVSYHHGQSNFKELVSKVKVLQDSGYDIGIWEVQHPEYADDCKKRQEQARTLGVDYRLKEFLGPYNGVNYGSMKYADAVNAEYLRVCECKTSELLIGPGGKIFRCHSDLYADRMPIGNILDPHTKASALGEWRTCKVYGRCNACDIKVTTDRYQRGGHTSVTIRDIQEPHATNDATEQTVNTYGK